MRSSNRVLLAALTIVFACESKPAGMESETIADEFGDGDGDGDGDTTADDEGDSSSTSEGSTTATGTDTTTDDESTSESDSTDVSDTTTDDDGCMLEEIPIGGFVPRSDIPSSECDPFLQDCMPGEKCVAYASQGSGWDANKCVPVLGDQTVGEPCTTTGVYEATDDCDADSFCWYWTVDYEGECVAFCEGTPDSPICDEGYSCSITNDGSLTLCLAGCDPLQQNCADGLGCYWVTDEFQCVATTQDLVEGEACGYINDCEPGQFCTNAMALPSCDGDACCAAFCNLDCPICELPGTDCAGFFEQGMAPAGLEDVGVCIAI